MWQPSWSPHPPQGAPQGQQAGTQSNPFQGLQQNTIGSQTMNHTQWMGPATGSHGCHPGSMASPVLGPASFHGPGGQLPSNLSRSLGPPVSGHQGQGFAVQCKHHQGCHSSMQSQQLMVGSSPTATFPPLGFGPGSQHGGYPGTSWTSFPAQHQPSPQLPQQVVRHHDASSNPMWPPTCSQPSPTSFSPSQPSPANPNQPKPCFQNNPLPGQVAQCPQVPQGTQGPQVPQGPPVLPHQPTYPGPPALQAPQVPQAPQIQQGDQIQQPPATPTSNTQLDTSKPTTLPTQGVQTPSANPSNLDLQALAQRLGATLEKSMEKGMESMAASLKSTLSLPTQLSSNTISSTPTSISPKPSTTVPTTTPTSTPVKAKPPIPPTDSSQQQQPSKNSLRSPLTREKRPSRRSRSRRRRRSRSSEPPKKRHHEPTSKKGPYASGHRGPEFLSSKKRHAPDRHTTPTYPQSTHAEPAPGRDRHHPIFRRANTFQQVHQDDKSTVYKKESERRDTRGSYPPPQAIQRNL